MDNENNEIESAATDSLKERLKNRIFKAGESFGNFRVVKCISSSLLANYYHMQHVRDLHDVTVCVFHPRTLKDPKCLKRLEMLQSMMKRVDHEGIPQIHDSAMINDRHCIFMDPVEGQSLSEYFAEHARPGVSGLSAADSTRIIALLLGLLGFAHAQGVDHRDMDTDLIFIQPDGSLRVLGLGVKAALGEDTFESVVSASVSPLDANEAPARLNSFDVMSSEYRRGVKEDYRVDISAVGCIGYWLLTSRKVDLTYYKAPSTLVEGLSTAWDEWFEWSLRRNQDERYQSCKSSLIGLKETEKGVATDGAGMIQWQIDCIPVPKGIIARGEFATRAYRIALIGLIAVSLAALLASFINTGAGEDKPRVVTVATDKSLANFSLSLVPAVSKVRFVGIDGEFTSKDGTLDLVVPRGEYELRVFAKNYVGQELSVSIGKGNPPEMKIELQPALVNLNIKTEPGATIVSLDEQGVEAELGVADAAGELHLNDRALGGNYRIAVQKTGYETVILEDLPRDLVEVPLVALPSSLTVRSNPVGARVTINGVEQGNTPLTMKVTDTSLTHVVVVDRPGYRAMEDRIEVGPGAHEVLYFGAFVERSAELDFAVTFEGVAPSEAESLMANLSVEIDGQQMAYDSSALKAVAEGTHVVRLLHPLYFSDPKTVTVKDQVKQTLSFIMNALPGRIQLVLPQPQQIELFVNGEPVDVVDGAVTVAASKGVELELRIRDHLTMLRTFDVTPNGQFVWEVTPVRIPGPVAGAEWTIPYQGLQFAWIPAGSFTMGSPMHEAGRLANEGPSTGVRFSQGFWAGVYEVTQGQYFNLVAQTPSSIAGAALPVDSVSWNDARKYCEQLTKVEKAAGRLPEGYLYRLPTEAEWEYFARANTTSPFTFGGRADATFGNFKGVYPDDSADLSRDSDHYGAVTVGSYAANGFGLFDVHGNLAEWTLDRYNGRLPGASLVDPRPRADGDRATVRGGSWGDFTVRVRSAARDGIRPETKSRAIGFRVVLAPVK